MTYYGRMRFLIVYPLKKMSYSCQYDKAQKGKECNNINMDSLNDIRFLADSNCIDCSHHI